MCARSRAGGAIRRCRCHEERRVGTLTGADPDRIGAVLEQRIGERNNVDVDALIHEWVPQVVEIVKDQVSPAA